MPKKLISIFLAFFIIVSIIIPADAAEPSISCYSSTGSKVTIKWINNPSRIQIFRDNVLFKDFQSNIPNGSQISFIETETGRHSFTAKAFNSDNTYVSSSCYVYGTGKSSIRLEFINKYTTYINVERIYNWVRIHNDGTNDLDLSKLKVRYFYTVDGEPSAAKPDANKGQKLAEYSDAKTTLSSSDLKFTDIYSEKQYKESVRASFTKVVPEIKNVAGDNVVDYYCDTYFENPGVDGIIPSVFYNFTLQPAFNKNVNDYESNSGNGSGFIKYYDPRNDYSFDATATDWKVNENICVYYDDELIWGIDPTIIKPTNLNAEFKDYSKVILNWTASPRATGYKVYRSEVPDDKYVEIATVTGTTFTDSNINTSVNGKKYYYKVVAMYDKINSSDSNVAETAVKNLVAPSNLQAKLKDFSNVTLSWNASLDAQSYDIYRSDSRYGEYIKINESKVTGTTYTDSKIQIGYSNREYYYKVLARYDSVESGYSNIDFVSVAKTLAAPTGLKADCNDNKNVILNWNASLDASSYDVYRSDSSNGEYVKINGSEVRGTTYTDSVEMGNTSKTYYYKVVARNSEAISGYSDFAYITISQILEAPTSVIAKFKDFSYVMLVWSPSLGAESYDVYRSESIEGTYTNIESGITGMTYKDNKVDTSIDGKQYFYKVVAKNSNSPDAESNIAEAVIKKLAAPTNLTAEFKDYSNVTLNWDASSGATGYKVFKSETPEDNEDNEDNYVEIANVTTTNFIDNDVNSSGYGIIIKSTGKNIHYKIKAVYTYRVDGEDKTVISDFSEIKDVFVPPHHISESWNYRLYINDKTAKKSAEYILGSYIPVTFEIKFNEDTKDPTITLDRTVTKTLDSPLDSKKTLDTSYFISSDKIYEISSDQRLLKVTLTREEALVENFAKTAKFVINKDSEGNIVNTDMQITGNFKKDDILIVEFVIKISANKTALESENGINAYYGKYILNFKLSGEQSVTKDGVVEPNTKVESAETEDLSVNIVKSDKLK